MIDYKQLVQDVLNGNEDPHKALHLLLSESINIDLCIAKVLEYQRKQIK